MLLFTVCATAMEVTEAERNLQPDPAKGIEDAVILMEQGEIDDTFTTTLSKQKHHLRIKIFTRKGVEDWGTVKISFDPQEENIGDVEASVWNPDGTVHQLNKDDIHKKKVSRKWGLKETEISFALPGVTEGSIIDYSFYRTYKETRKVSYWYSQHEIYCMHSEVTFIPWPGRRWGFTGGNMHAQPDVSEVRRKGQKALTYISRNVPPLPREEMSPPYNSVREYVCFYYGDSDTKYKDFWVDWGTDYYKLILAKRMRKCSATKLLAKEEIAGAGGWDGIDKCYNYVISHYVPFANMSKAQQAEIDDAYIKKLSRADDVKHMLELPYLSDWQMTLILASLIDATVPDAKMSIGYYTPWNRRLFNKDLHTLYQFTDYLLRVEYGGEVRWLCPGKGMLKAGDIEFGAYEVPILLMDDTGARFEQLSAPTGDNIVTRVQADVYVEEEQVRIHRTTTYDPYESFDQRTDLMYYTDAEMHDVLKEQLEDLYGDKVELVKQRVENLNDIEKPLVIEEEFTFPYEMEELGDKIFFKMVGMSRYVRNPFNTEKRRTFIMFPYPGEVEQKLTYHLPEYFALESLPRDDSVTTPAMDYRVTLRRVDDRTFTVETGEKLKVNMFAARAHDKFKDLFNRILAMSSPKAVLKETD